jgi:exosortase
MNTNAHAESAIAPPSSPVTSASPLPVWAGAAAFAGVLAVLFGPTLFDLVTLWTNDPNYNHGFLVLPIAIALGVRTYLRTAGPVGRPDRKLGWFAILLGGLSHLAALLFVLPLLDFLALLFLARGGLLLAGGRAWASAFTFPLVFLLFLFPLPPTWLSTVALWLQDIAARVSETILSLFVVCSRNGHNLRIAGLDESLVVAEECSGTRQIVAFVALAALYGHLTSRNPAYKLLLLLLSVPVAVFANVLRVVLMNLGAYWFGTKWMSGWMHDMPALFSLPVGLVLFFVIDRTLTRIFARAPVPAAGAEPVPPSVTRHPVPDDFSRRWVPAVVAGLGLFGGSLLFQRHLDAAGEQSYPQANGGFDTIPLKFAPSTQANPGWVGLDLVQEREEVRKQLLFRVDDLMYRGYQTTDQKSIASVYMVYSRTGEDRKHHPEVCIRDVSGAPEDPAFRTTVPLAAADRKAQRFRFLSTGNQSTIVYYWHYTLTPEAVARSPFQAIHQQIGTAPPSVTVQVRAPYDERTAQAIERELLPQLDAAMTRTVLPENTAVGCNRLPVVFVRR